MKARAAIFRQIVMIWAGVGLVGVLLALPSLLSRGMWQVALASMGMMLLVGAMALAQKLPFTLRVIVVLSTVYAALVQDFIANGYFRNATVFAFTLILFSEFFLGWKAFAASLALVLITYGGFAWLLQTGRLIPQRPENSPAEWDERIAAPILVLLFGTLMAIAARRLVSSLTQTLSSRDELVSDLEMQMARRDLAERVLQSAQERAAESQKLEAVGQLSGGIAHDFNNLLAVIMASAASARDRVPQSDPLAAYLREIEVAAATGRDLNAKLLAFSRQQRLRPRLINPNDLLRDIAKIAGHLLDKRVVVHSRLAEGLGSMLVDENQMQQVLLNMILNARDAMPDGGHLSLESFAATRPPKGLPEGLYVGLRVADTGLGMDEPTRRRIFEPFYTTKEVGKGTGLGLSTALGIVQQSGGSIEVQSEPGQGCTFVIYLPMSVSASQSDGPDARLLSSSGTARAEDAGVLIVDDNASLRRLNAAVLADRGYTVFEASDGIKAFELLRREEGRIGLLITDAIMPNMSGSELAAKVRKSWPKMRVLMISGYEKHEAQGEGAQLDGFLQKPFLPNELIALTKDLLG